jgi:hypothetical protein
VLRNPAGNGGHVQYVIDDKAFSLGPGQSHRSTGRASWLIRFHRGEEHGDVE